MNKVIIKYAGYSTSDAKGLELYSEERNYIVNLCSGSRFLSSIFCYRLENLNFDIEEQTIRVCRSNTLTFSYYSPEILVPLNFIVECKNFNSFIIEKITYNSPSKTQYHLGI